MDCFIDSIGLLYCSGETAPVSGLYLNTLPGISVEGMDSVADSEQVTYLGVYSDVQKVALSQFRLDLLHQIHSCYSLNTDCDYDELICANKELLYRAWWYLLGVHSMAFRLASDRLNWFTTVSRDDAKGLQAVFQVEYEKSMQQAALLFDTGDCCMPCNPSPKRAVWLP